MGSCLVLGHAEVYGVACKGQVQLSSLKNTFVYKMIFIYYFHIVPISSARYRLQLLISWLWPSGPGDVSHEINLVLRNSLSFPSPPPEGVKQDLLGFQVRGSTRRYLLGPGSIIHRRRELTG